MQCGKCWHCARLWAECVRGEVRAAEPRQPTSAVFAFAVTGTGLMRL